MYERINGKLYKLIDENEMIVKFTPIMEKIKSYNTGIDTCLKSIESFTEQKIKYENEITKLLDNSELTLEEMEIMLNNKANGVVG